jgi:hypothetical protein
LKGNLAMKPKMIAAAFLALALATMPTFAADDLTATGPEPTGKVTSKEPATLVPTFHCLSIYWSPEGGEANKKVFVKFREAGQTAWRDGLSMRYNPINDWNHPGSKTPESKGDYRGSIVNLKPNTHYEVALTLAGTDTATIAKAATWNEKFPIASTVKCDSSNSTLEITNSGTPDGYILYDGAGATIDTANKADAGITVNASYVILRGFTIKNVKSHGINLEKAHHVVIENCDISQWGSEDPDFKGTGFGVEMNSGIYSHDKSLSNIVVQRCKIHNPTWNSNSWAQKHHTMHPDGPQAISFWEPEGNNVIRYNEFWSDEKHYFNDTIGGAFNGSYRGWPGHDSDIYGNYIANCWDDGIEVEGSGQNIRIWNNYLEHTMNTIANAAVSIGPLYIWQNVAGPSRRSAPNKGNGNFMKMGYAGSEDWMTGHMYVFNNTLWQANDDGPTGLGEDRVIKHCVTRNNLLQIRSTERQSISRDKRSKDNDFDYDLVTGQVPNNSEPHAIKEKPKYVPGAGFNFETKTGNFQQTPDSPGYHKAEIIPNFCEANSPDMGAQQSGTPPMVYGVKAEFVPSDPKK